MSSSTTLQPVKRPKFTPCFFWGGIAFLLAFCSSQNAHVDSFQLASFQKHGLSRTNKCKIIISEASYLQSSLTTTTIAAAGNNSGESFASQWMENEKRIEDRMDTENKAKKHPLDNNEDESNLPFGKWECISGNYILRPPDEQPRALIHFLGGALLGAAPQLTYRYFLERLARRGYLVVATPYQLSFDHLKSCDEIIDKFERVAPSLAKQYGPVPVVGVGHSCGALLHMLITSLFPDTPRAANALISYNNRGVSEAVPFFEELVVPLFSDRDRNGSELMKSFIKVTREKYNGKVPSDESLIKLLQSLPVPGMETLISPSLVSIPTPLRQSLTNTLIEPLYESLTNAGVTPLLLSSLDITQQIPKLIDEVESGARDFVPTPDAMSSAARRAYRCRRTLLVQFDNDNIDDSEQLEGYLKEAESVMKMKRPMITIDLKRKVLNGNHLTPLLGPAGGENWGTALEDALGEILSKGASEADKEGDDIKENSVRERLGYGQLEKVIEELITWLDEGSL